MISFDLVEVEGFEIKTITLQSQFGNALYKKEGTKSGPKYAAA